MEYPISFVCLLGVAIVFIGLICIIILCKVLSAVCNVGSRSKTTKSETTASQATVQNPIPNRKKIVVAISAAIGEELGTDVSAIKIVSLKKL